MRTAIKMEYVLTKSANAYQDGIHERIAQVSDKNELYLSKLQVWTVL